MARLTAISGVGGKLPAAFLLEIEGKRILLDLGEGPEPGVFPDVNGIGSIDAICLSHAHMDHAGALHLAARLGNPSIHATAMTFRALGLDPAEDLRLRLLPQWGEAVIDGVRVTLGRCGHAPGGVWFHFPAEGGVLYTGDWSAESLLLPFDPPPPAALVVTDASYGDRETSLAEQIDAIARAAEGGAVLPVPGGGRGPEMALALASLGVAAKVSPEIRLEMQALVEDETAIEPDRRQALQLFLEQEQQTVWGPSDILVVTEANGEAGASAELVNRLDEGFRFIFSGHVPRGTPADSLLASGRAIWLPWNVHPRLSDVLALADATAATQVMPAFVTAASMPRLAEVLGDRLVIGRAATTSTEDISYRTIEA